MKLSTDTEYYSIRINEYAESYAAQGKKYWESEGEQQALNLFHAMSVRIPAYKDFLSKQKVDPAKIRTIQEFQKVPPIEKTNYIDVYPLHELCWEGKLSSLYMLSASSGSTGKPYFWPRSVEQTAHGAFISEILYTEFFGMGTLRTLYINAFAMGTWVAGTYMMMSTLLTAQKGLPVTVVTPGLNKDEILRLVQLGKEEFDQVILVGYPPFVKDVVDYGVAQGLSWRDVNIKFLFSGEAITEGWRTHLQKKTGLHNIATDTINIYGSADVGLVAHETPLTTTLRRLLMGDHELVRQLFSSERVPALYQCDPRLRYFEQSGEELLVSAPSGIPLVRYNTKDIGGVCWWEDIAEVLPHKEREALHSQVLPRHLWNLPIVYLFGRGKFSATLYGITIFPEYIKHLLDHPSLEQLFTGKFVLKTEETMSHDQELSIHLELKDGHEPSGDAEELSLQILLEELPKISSEYKHLLSSMGERVHPKIILHTYGDPEYFPRGVIKKTS